MLALTPPMCQWWWAGTLGLICVTLSIIARACEALQAPPGLTFVLGGICASDMVWLATNAAFEVLSADVERWRIAPGHKHASTKESREYAMKQIRAKLAGWWLDMCIFAGVWCTSKLSFSCEGGLLSSVAGFLLMLCLLDFGLSSWHCILHLPGMYRYHKLHHSIKVTRPWTNEVEHPVEALGNAAVKYGSVVLVSRCLELSPSVAFAYFMFSTWYLCHSGITFYLFKGTNTQ